MVEFIVIVLGTALLLYVLLGGADFGAGILEIFTGSKGEETISEAIAPVWEANHVWLVLIVVILFMGFPPVYAIMTTELHLPVLMALIGIIFRGTAFTFRHYDVQQDYTHRFYSLTFRISSVITPMFLGIVAGAMILGRVNPEAGNFYGRFIAPWLNVFPIMFGIFTCVLFTWLASVFLIGETDDETNRAIYTSYAKRMTLAVILTGGLLFGAAEASGWSLVSRFLESTTSMLSLLIATLSIPVLWTQLNWQNIGGSRLVAGAQTTLILLGWFSIQYPEIIRFANKPSTTFYNAHAPEATLLQLIIALAVGIVIVIPAFYYLFRVFKLQR